MKTWFVITFFAVVLIIFYTTIRQNNSSSDLIDIFNKKPDFVIDDTSHSTHANAVGELLQIKGKLIHVVDKSGEPSLMIEGNYYCKLNSNYSGKLTKLKLGNQVKVKGYVRQVLPMGTLLYPAELIDTSK